MLPSFKDKVISVGQFVSATLLIIILIIKEKEKMRDASSCVVNKGLDEAKTFRFQPFNKDVWVAALN